MLHSKQDNDSSNVSKHKTLDYEAKVNEMDEKLHATRALSQEFARKVADDDTLKEYHHYDLVYLESEIKKRIHDLEKYREKARKKREKEGAKFDKMIDKVVMESRKLAQEDEYESDTERTLVEELTMLQLEAKRLADEIILEQRVFGTEIEDIDRELYIAENQADDAAVRRIKESNQYLLRETEAEIGKRVQKLEKYREKFRKEREKEDEKLEKLVDNVVTESKKLEREDEYESDTERNLEEELVQLRIQAKRLADEIAREQKQSVDYAEITEHVLVKAEELANQEAKELNHCEKEDWFNIENRLRDLTINKDLAIRKVEALESKLKMLKEDLEEKREILDKDRKSAKEAEEAAAKLRNDILIEDHELKTLCRNDNDAHIWLENLRRKEHRIYLLQEDGKPVAEEISSAITVIKEIADKKFETEAKLHRLQQREVDEDKRAEYLKSKVDREIAAIRTYEGLWQETEGQLEEAEEELQAISQEKKKVKAEAFEFRQKAAEANAKAKKLAEVLKKGRKEAQTKLQDIIGDEREAIHEAYQLGKDLKPTVNKNQTVIY